jgi:hypothetical protein
MQLQLQNEIMDDAQTRGGEGGRRVRLHLRLQNEAGDDKRPGGGEGVVETTKRGQGRRTAWRWRGMATCQIAVAIAERGNG